MAITPAPWLVTGNADRTMNAVMTRQSGNIFALWSGPHSGNQAFGIDLSGWRLYAPYTYGAGDTLGVAIDNGTTHIISAIREAGVSSGYQNGGLQASNNTPINTGSSFGMGIGTRPDGISVDGDYSEIIYFSKAISVRERQFLERNQGSWFGISVATGTPLVQLSVSTSSQTISNPVETANWKSIPGAIYRTDASIINQADSPDANSVTVVLSFPADVDAYTGTGVATPPVTLSNGSPGCGVTINYVGLASTTDGVDFLDASNVAIVPSPDGSGYSSNVRAIRIRLSGTIAARWGSANPSCSITSFGRIL